MASRVVAVYTLWRRLSWVRGRHVSQSEDPMGEGLAPALGCLLGAL
jgi:hypothetical protein